jgi:3-oxoacyl-[acyl-carrier protein] reductase
MEISLKNKTAIVTGASRGIGRQIALKLGKLGASVAVNYANNSRAAEAVCSEIADAGGQAVALCADMRKTKEVAWLFDRTLECFGSLEILVNNAGIALFKEIKDISEEEFDNIFAKISQPLSNRKK